MAIGLAYGGHQRSYELLMPVGIEHWYTTAGLPLIVALHGFGNEPEVFKSQWDFDGLANLATLAENKFVVIVPHGLSVANKLPELGKRRRSDCGTTSRRPTR
jgi:poly(3-hydroxybutyrate) depolymerase